MNFIPQTPLSEKLQKFIYISDNDFIDKRPVVIIDSAAEIHIKKKDYGQVIGYICKILQESLKRTSNPEYKQFCIMVQLKHLKKCKIGLGFAIALAKILKVMFVDTLYKCYLIDPPLLFKSMFQVIKPFIDKETRPKLTLIKKGENMPYNELYD